MAPGPLSAPLRLLAAAVLALTLLALSGSGWANGTPMGASSPRHAPVPAGPYAVILVIDAARYDELNLDAMPNLRRIAQSGTQYSQAWVGQLPSITETSHATIGTGVLPSRHLVLGDTWRVPGTNSMAPDLLNGQLTRTGYIGKFIRQTGVPSLAGIIHARYPGSRVVALSGHKVYAADGLGAGGADYVAFGVKDSRSHYIPSAIPGHAPAASILTSPQLDLPVYPRKPGVEDEWTTTLALKFLFKYHPRVLMVNFPEVDVWGHIAGTKATVMQPLMANIDHQIGRILAAYGRAGILDRTYFVITSDHAMVPAMHTIPSSAIQAAIGAAGGEPLYVGHGDYCPIWLRNPQAVARVAAGLVHTSIRGVAAVFRKVSATRYELASPRSALGSADAERAYTDLLSTFASAESPDIVLLYDENTITMTPNFLKIGRAGDHGGATWGAQHIPLFLMGPGIRQAYVSDYPARLVDIAPTVEVLLGAQPRGQDGVVLADALVHPPQVLVAKQQAAATEALFDVTALQAEASARPNLRR